MSSNPLDGQLGEFGSISTFYLSHSHVTREESAFRLCLANGLFDDHNPQN